MRLRLLAEKFEDGFVLQPVLARFFEPGFSQWSQPGEVIPCYGIIGERRRREQETAFCERVRFAGDGQVFLLLKGHNRQASLRTKHAVERSGGNALAGQRQLRFKNVLGHAGQKAGGVCAGGDFRRGRDDHRWRAARAPRGIRDRR